MNKNLSSSYFYFIMIFLYLSEVRAQEKIETLSNNNPLESAPNFNSSQFKTQNNLDGFGYYKMYNNTFSYKTDKLGITLGAGLLEENTIFNDKAPGFYGSLNASFDYEFTNRYSFNLFGQYLSPSFNGEKKLDDLYMNPLFPQTEIGAGFKGNFNNINIDVGARTLLDTQLNQPGPRTLLNSKVSIGF